MGRIAKDVRMTPIAGRASNAQNRCFIRSHVGNHYLEQEIMVSGDEVTCYYLGHGEDGLSEGVSVVV